MMNYSFMSFSAPALSLKASLEAAVKFGYSGFEPRLDSRHAHGIEVNSSAQFLAEARKMAEDFGVKYSCVATSCKLAIPNGLADNITAAERAISLAEKIGCKAIRVFGGNLPEGLTREKAMDALKQSLSHLVRTANGSGVNICLETHDDWCDPFTVSEVARESGCAVNWDIMHTFLTGKYSPEKAFDLLKPHIRHVHIHDGKRSGGKLEFFSIGKGDVDHCVPVKLLKDSGYSGFISGEWIGWEPWEDHLPREIKILKSYE